MLSERVLQEPHYMPFKSDFHHDNNSMDSNNCPDTSSRKRIERVKPRKPQPELSRLVLEPVDDLSPFPDGDRFVSGGIMLENGDFVATPPTGTRQENFWDYGSPVYSSFFDFGRKHQINQTPLKKDVEIKYDFNEEFALESTTGIANESSDPIQTESYIKPEINVKNKDVEAQFESTKKDIHTQENDQLSELQSDSIDTDSDLRATKKRKRDQIEKSEDQNLKKKRKKGRSQGHNKGSWTEVEHQLFLEGLEKFGRSKWREISEYVGTRSRIQVASHSQKYFAKSEEGKSPHRKMRTKKSLED